MSEDLGIQKQQPSAAPYALGGAVVGGTGAYFVTDHFTKPKYHKDIIDGMDPDTFESKHKEATGDNVKLLDAAKEVRDASATAEAKYQTELAAFQKAGAQVVNETPEYKKLAETATEKQNALNAEKEKLIADKIKELKSQKSEVKTASIEEVLNKRIENTAKRTVYLEKLRSEGAPKEVIDAVDKSIKEYMKETEKLCETIAEKAEYMLNGYVSDKKAAVANAYKEKVSAQLEQELKILDNKKSVDNTPKTIKNLTENRKLQTEAKDAIKKAETELQELVGKNGDLTSRTNVTIKELESKIIALDSYIESYKATSGEVTAEFQAKEKELADAIKKYDAINKAKADIESSTKALNNFRTAETDLISAFENKFGKGATLRNGVVYDKNNKPIKIKTPSAQGQHARVAVNLPKGVRFPKGTVIEYTTGGVSNLSDAEVRSAAEKSFNRSEAFEALSKEFEAAEATRKTAFDALPKSVATEAEFLEKQGVKDKAEYIAKEVEAKKNSFMETYGKQLESKLGKNAGWKLAAIIAGGALLGAGIGKLIAPKGDKA